MSDPDRRRAALDLLLFYREAGVAETLDEEPHDRLAEPAPPSPRLREEAGSRSEPGERRAGAPAFLGAAPRPSPAATSSSRQRGEGSAPAAPEAAAADARARAAAAATLDELRALMEAFEGCELKRGALQLCFSDGDPSARLMFVGEGPGGEEDRQGKPFVGRAGQLLDRMLASIGLDRAKVYIANVVPWRPPANRDPTPAELAICLPFITRQIELVNPDVLVCVGRISGQTLLGLRDGILKSRGRWMRYAAGGREIPAMATLHPAYLLRQPSQKRLAWRDFKAIRAKLREGAISDSA